jgi:cell division protein FtsN
MKRSNIVGLDITCLVALILALTSCKSSESAYKSAYEAAKKQEATTNNKEKTGINAVTTQTMPLVSVSNGTNIRKEKVTVVPGNNALKTYGVVCGSFGLKANADALKDYLQSEGYSKATVVFNTEIVMYRVIADSYNDKESAVYARNTFKAKYPNRNDFQDAWILEKL